MADFTLQALADEIEADPAALGYKEVGGEWKGDGVIADLINAKDFVIDRASIPMAATRSKVTFAAYNTLSIDEQEWIRWMTPGGGDGGAGGDGGNFETTPDMKLQLTGRTVAANGVAGTGADGDSFWAAAHDQDMAPAMLALIEVPGSRAEVLWGEGQSISIGNVGRAANL